MHPFNPTEKTGGATILPVMNKKLVRTIRRVQKDGGTHAMALAWIWMPRIWNQTTSSHCSKAHTTVCAGKCTSRTRKNIHLNRTRLHCAAEAFSVGLRETRVLHTQCTIYLV